MNNLKIYIGESKNPNTLSSLSELGGKAANLNKLRSLNLNIPHWISINTSMMEIALSEIMAEINNIVESIDYNSFSSIRKCSVKIKTLILQHNISKEYILLIKDSIRSNFSTGSLLAVRSSVVDEDSKDNSFAGQMVSYLNINIENIIDHIKLVWCSAYSANALLYRNKKNIQSKSIKCAVIIQNMVEAESSGIIFTRNPNNGNNESVISAAFGLGEGVVNNSVECDTYILPMNSKNYISKIANKQKGIFYNNHMHENEFRTIDKHKSGLPVLNRTQIFEINKTAYKIEKLFNTPVDVEWCYDNKGTLTILQARPITCRHIQEYDADITIWDNSNIVESYPGITLPLTFSLLKKAYERSFKNAILKSIPFDKKLNTNTHLFKNMIGYFYGRVYYNLTNWYKMMSYLPNFKKYKKNWDTMIGISKKVEFPATKLSILNKVYSYLIIIKRLVFTNSTIKKFFKQFNSINHFYRQIDYESKSEKELISLFRSLDKDATKIWHLTLFNDFNAIKYYGWLKLLCKKWFKSYQSNLENELLCNANKMESVEPVRAINEILDEIKSDIRNIKLFEKTNSEEILEIIRNNEYYNLLNYKIDEYLSNYGDRNIEELKLENIGYRERPAEFISLIKRSLVSGKTYNEIIKNEQKISQEALKYVNGNLKNPFKKLLLRFIILKSRNAIAGRENMRFARTRLFGIIKMIFFRFGEILAKQNIIEKTGDIHYLSIEEIFDYVEGSSVNMNLNKMIKTRKKEFNEFKNKCVPDRFFTNGIPYTSVLDSEMVIDNHENFIQGVGCSSGNIEGITKLVFDPKMVIKEKDYILLAESTDPGWVFQIASAKGIIVERGSILSHSAIIGRELGIPSIVGAKDAIRLIGDNRHVFMNGATGEIQWN